MVIARTPVGNCDSRFVRRSQMQILKAFRLLDDAGKAFDLRVRQFELFLTS